MPGGGATQSQARSRRYLGVVGVAPTDAGVEFTSADDPHAIDYLVEMRRYDERDTAPSCWNGATSSDPRSRRWAARAFRRRFDRAAFRKSFGDAAPTLFLECQAPAAELAARADRRAQDSTRVSDADLEIVMRERSSWEPLDEIPASEQFVLRTDRPLDDIIQELYALLDRRL